MEPFDGTRLEAHLAQIAMILANAHRGKNSQPISLTECLLKWDTDRASDHDAARLRLKAALNAAAIGGGKRGANSNRKPAS